MNLARNSFLFILGILKSHKIGKKAYPTKKALAWVDFEKSGNDLSPEKSLQKTLHPHAGHNTYSSHYTVSTGSDVVEE